MVQHYRQRLMLCYNLLFLLTAFMLCKANIAQRFTRSLSSYEHHATAQREIASRLLELLKDFAPHKIDCVLEIGCGSGVYTHMLQKHLSAKQWHINDLCEACSNYVAADFFLAGDIENVPLDASYDLVTSASTFQWIANPALLLRKLNACLKTGGILAFSTFTPNNLFQIRTLTQAGLVYPSIEAWQKLLHQNGFQTNHISDHAITLTFDNARAVLKHLQHTGVTATQKHIWTKNRLLDFETQYRNRYETNGKLPLTYTPLYIIAQRTDSPTS